MATDQEILERWKTEDDFSIRDEILNQLTDRGLYPPMEAEAEGGLYPDTEDPLFLEKLLKKREFAEHKQKSISELMEEGDNPCDPNKEFELSPVQRFVSRFLSPTNPYMSALLYHGVGVGKTCAAITVAEAFLEMFPKKSVIIVAPPNIQPGFERTIFQEERLTVDPDESIANEIKGCTGNTYLKLTGTEYVKDKKSIIARITRLRNKRYQMYGYTQFYNYVYQALQRGVSKGVDGERRKQQETDILRRLFSGKLLIIDESHNLRDIPGESKEENKDAPGGTMELTESEAGKKLTPYLRQILSATDGLKLLLLTATPMYNSYREIIFLLNLLLLNDKKATLREDDIFDINGNFKANGELLLGRVTSAYLSFMRGENPLSFPIRLIPEGIPLVTSWPHQSPRGEPVSEDDRVRTKNLPFVSCPFQGDTLQEYKQLAQETVQQYGLGLTTMDMMVQAGNWIFPGQGDIKARIQETGFSGVFTEETRGSLKTFRANDATWLREETLGLYSPKASMILQRLKTTKGVSFVYSRYVKTGALTIALALEANGYTLVGRDAPLLVNGNQSTEGRQCALCSRKEKTHKEADHGFIPAYYVLLTGRDEYSPNNKLSVDTARSDTNLDGKKVKVVLGSQVAAEGIDLRFIREVFVFDSWYHMNKLEQVIGRAIRMCSHSLLPIDDRNCTINLLVTTFSDEDKETLDMYQYRQALSKAVLVGKVTRVLKRYAVDCNLNKDAIQITGLPSRKQVDAQGRIRPEVNINDMPFTSMCDWLETCDYTCGKPIKIEPFEEDDSTYDEYAAKWRESMIKERLRKLFTRQAYYRKEDLELLMEDIPRIALETILRSVVGNKSFRINNGTQEGYIIFKNGLYLFQPSAIQDTFLPLSLRVASFPVKRDSYHPLTIRPMNEKPTVDQSAVTTVQQPVVTEVLQDYKPFWNSILEWSGMISAGTATLVIPNPVKDAVKSRYGSNKKEVQRIMNVLFMVPWLYKVLTKDSWKERYGVVVSEMVWDELLRPNEQYKIYQETKETPLLKEVWREHVLVSGATHGFRIINPVLGKIEYFCNGVACSPALIGVFEGEASDPLKGLKANTSTTSSIYGTVNFKKGLFVFKTNEPVDASKKAPNVGSECANVSNTSGHLKLLKQIGEKARELVGFDFELTDAGLINRPIENASQVCSLTDLALRLLHKLRPEGTKRWFYRPVATFKTGHKGTINK